MSAASFVVLGLTYVLIAGMAIAVNRDAKHIGVRPGVLPGLLGWGTTGWTVLSLFLNVLAVPVYAFIARPRLILKIRQLDRVHPLPARQVRGVPSSAFPKVMLGMLLLLIALVVVNNALIVRLPR